MRKDKYVPTQEETKILNEFRVKYEECQKRSRERADIVAACLKKLQSIAPEHWTAINVRQWFTNNQKSRQCKLVTMIPPGQTPGFEPRVSFTPSPLLGTATSGTLSGFGLSGSSGTGLLRVPSGSGSLNSSGPGMSPFNEERDYVPFGTPSLNGSLGSWETGLFRISSGSGFSETGLSGAPPSNEAPPSSRRESSMLQFSPLGLPPGRKVDWGSANRHNSDEHQTESSVSHDSAASRLETLYKWKNVFESEVEWHEICRSGEAACEVIVESQHSTIESSSGRCILEEGRASEIEGRIECCRYVQGKLVHAVRAKGTEGDLREFLGVGDMKTETGLFSAVNIIAVASPPDQGRDEEEIRGSIWVMGDVRIKEFKLPKKQTEQRELERGETLRIPGGFEIGRCDVIAHSEFVMMCNGVGDVFVWYLTDKGQKEIEMRSFHSEGKPHLSPRKYENRCQPFYREHADNDIGRFPGGIIDEANFCPTSLCLLPSGKAKVAVAGNDYETKVAVAGNDYETIHIWKRRKGAKRGEEFCHVSSLIGHTGGITTMSAFQIDNDNHGQDTVLASGSLDGTIRLWKIGFGRSMRVLKLDTIPHSLLYLGDSEILITSVTSDGKDSYVDCNRWGVAIEPVRLIQRKKVPTRRVFAYYKREEKVYRLILMPDRDETVTQCLSFQER